MSLLLARKCPSSDTCELIVSSQVSDEGHLRVEVHVHEEDAGKVIGRQGRVVKSIRTLARAAADGSISAVDVEIV